jgi:hypothetical protein
MPLQNRVDPFGEIHAVTARGTFYGNRGGCFHRGDQTLKPRRWASRQWIVCVLQFKGRRRALMQPGRFTELFFLDELTALAAGHRPCFECRRADAAVFRDLLVGAGALLPGARVAAMDDLLAGEVQAVLTGASRRERVAPAALPDGALYTAGGAAFVKWQGAARRWTFTGYGAPHCLHETGARLTPAATCAALAAGYQPCPHPSLTH